MKWAQKFSLAAAICLDDRLRQWLESTAPHWLCVACSGGSDSMALLLLLHEISTFRGRLLVFHFDHHTRNGASHADAEFVQNFAQTLGIPVIVGQRNITSEPATNEDQLRHHRFRFFHREMAQLSTPYLLTAHHRDDVIETFLMRLARGSSIDGLVALQPVERRRDGYIYVRPLLSYSKVGLQKYLRDRGISWREDESNATDHHLRNRVRHQLIPLWKSLEPLRSWDTSILRTRDLLMEDGQALAQMSSQLFKDAYRENILLLKPLRNQPAAILRRVLHHFFLENGRPLERPLMDHLLSLCREFPRFKVSLSPSAECVCDGQSLFLRDK